MLVKVWWTDELVELTEELVNEMIRRADEDSGRYHNYIPSFIWENGVMTFIEDGPWEC